MSGIEGIAELPFVSRDDEGAHLWSPDRSGTYSERVARGRHYADMLIAHVRRTTNTPLLGHVCAAISGVVVKGAPFTGVETGFFQRLAERAVG